MLLGDICCWSRLQFGFLYGVPELGYYQVRRFVRCEDHQEGSHRRRHQAPQGCFQEHVCSDCLFECPVTPLFCGWIAIRKARTSASRCWMSSSLPSRTSTIARKCSELASLPLHLLISEKPCRTCPSPMRTRACL